MPREIKKMNKEKQIFEIKDCIDAVCGADCAYFDIDGFAIANEIYKKGYRKASDVAEKIFAEIEKNMVSIDDIDFNRFRAIGRRTFAEIKKKYSEGEGCL